MCLTELGIFACMTEMGVPACSLGDSSDALKQLNEVWIEKRKQERSRTHVHRAPPGCLQW